jgi:hypothetical protein
MGRRRGVNEAGEDVGCRKPFVLWGGVGTGPFSLVGGESIVGGGTGGNRSMLMTSRFSNNLPPALVQSCVNSWH